MSELFEGEYISTVNDVEFELLRLNNNIRGLYCVGLMPGLRELRYYDEFGYFKYMDYSWWLEPDRLCYTYDKPNGRDHLINSPHYEEIKNVTYHSGTFESFNYVPFHCVNLTIYADNSKNELESLEGCPAGVKKLSLGGYILYSVEGCPPNLESLACLDTHSKACDLTLLPPSVVRVFFCDKHYVTDDYESTYPIADEKCIDKLHEKNAIKLRGMRTKSARK